MPRIARAVAAGFPHHVIHRGNNKEAVFSDEEDRRRYMTLLAKYSTKWESPILSYCLMSNHVHLLSKPQENESLYKMMQGVTLCFTQHINRKYNRTGRLWESRYHSCIVDSEQYLWAVARYIEQNPVRAMIAINPEDYPYSSARAHFGLAEGKGSALDIGHQQECKRQGGSRKHVPEILYRPPVDIGAFGLQRFGDLPSGLSDDLQSLIVADRVFLS